MHEGTLLYKATFARDYNKTYQKDKKKKYKDNFI